MNDVSEAGGNRETSEGEVEQAMGDERMVRSDVLSRANLLITGDAQNNTEVQARTSIALRRCGLLILAGMCLHMMWLT